MILPMAPRWAALLLAIFAVVQADDVKLDSKECAELGFTQDLRCTTCTRLQEFLPSGDQKGAEDSGKLLKECQSCCQSSGEEVFKRAELYVCPSQIKFDQDIEDFVKRKADAFKDLEVKRQDGVRTTLLLFREGEKVSEDSRSSKGERVNIQGWKSDEIRDFLSMKLGVPVPKSN
eukprot:TRINITY_DN77524_c0_g1_i1.p1 TRINITY_DN77524_c0_g1~~TRINITY_DN77524_c0_g1_i1.p1  ORF type:complete len:175 (+),score=46.90 TRINITY_DN77524_c0_g1_i1:84-608(+)